MRKKILNVGTLILSNNHPKSKQMPLKLLLFLMLYFFTGIFNDSYAQDSGIIAECGVNAAESRRAKIKSGSLEETALKGGWTLELIDTARDLDYLNNTEKDVILALNMVRTNPCRYAELYVKPIISSFRGNYRRRTGRLVRTFEGRLPAEELYEYLMHLVPGPALVPAPGLHRSADELALDQSLTGKTGHVSSEGRDYDMRIRSCGRCKQEIAETIDYGGMTGFDMVNNLLIDDNVSDRGHRIIMMKPVFHYVGVSVRAHKEYKSIAVMDYAGSFTDN